MPGTPSIEEKATSVAEPRLKKLAKLLGPGIIAVLSWLGAGDLITSSVAGASYGYAMMWVLAISLLLRFLIVNIIARFQLCNNQGMTILQGYAQLHPFFAWFMLAYALLMGHLINAYMIKGAGEALAMLLHINQPLLCSVAVVIAVWLLVGRNIYAMIEGVMKVLLAIMTLAFLTLAIMSGPDVTGIIKGTIGFSIPPDEGVHGALLVAVSVIGAVAGSIANFVHPYVMREKGWIGPQHKRIQRNDLLFAVIVGIVINLAIWVVGVEILRPNGIQVNTLAIWARRWNCSSVRWAGTSSSSACSPRCSPVFPARPPRSRCSSPTRSSTSARNAAHAMARSFTVIRCISGSCCSFW